MKRLLINNERSLVLFLVGLLLLNPPLLLSFTEQSLLFGVPLLYLYLFAVWFGFILLIRLSARAPDDPPEDEREAGEDGRGRGDA